MPKIKVMSVGAARPNFMKIAPFARAIREESLIFDHFLVHTGQHYDDAMSASFFRELHIPVPDANLGVGSGTHAEQVGRTMIEFEKVVRKWKPDWIVVVGDVNATCACSITAAKEHVRLAHIEAGLRSFDRTMPEEINRMVTDRLADLLFTTDRFANRNLRDEGVPAKKIKFVGNIMIDTMEANRMTAARLSIQKIIAANLIGRSGQEPESDFAVMTLHRPSNADSRDALRSLVSLITGHVSRELTVIWTIHPRVEKRLREFGLWKAVVSCPGLRLLRPITYREMLKLNMEAALMLTDSGGLQEECCVLGTPCVTMRDTTERPITLRKHGGVSILSGNDPDRIKRAVASALRMRRTPVRPPLWDGNAAERIVKVLSERG